MYYTTVLNFRHILFSFIPIFRLPIKSVIALHYTLQNVITFCRVERVIQKSHERMTYIPNINYNTSLVRV